MYSSVLSGSRSEQSASLPGSPPPLSALLRTVSRALRAASRATRRVERLVDDLLRDAGVLLEVLHQAVVDDRRRDALDLGRDELDLGLRLEAGIRVLDREHDHEALAHVVAGDRGILFLQQIVRLRVLVDRAGERGAEADQVRAAVRIRDGVREATASGRCSCRCTASRSPQTCSPRPPPGPWSGRRPSACRQCTIGFGCSTCLLSLSWRDEFDDAVLVEKRLAARRLEPLVGEHDGQARIEERQFAQPAGEARIKELRRDRENRRVRLKRNQRAGLVRFGACRRRSAFASSRRARTPCGRPCRRAGPRP